MEFHAYWQKLSGDEKESVATAAATKVVYLSQVAYGHRKVSGHLALRLEIATGGAVSRHELRPDLYPVEHERRRTDEAAA